MAFADFVRLNAFSQLSRSCRYFVRQTWQESERNANRWFGRFRTEATPTDPVIALSHCRIGSGPYHASRAIQKYRRHDAADRHVSGATLLERRRLKIERHHYRIAPMRTLFHVRNREESQHIDDCRLPLPA
jgi:hypothetical protein